MDEASHRPTTAELVGQLKDEVTLLIRQERTLIRKEIRQKVAQAKTGAIYATAAATLLYLGLLFLLIALTAGLVALLQWSGLALGHAVWMGPLMTSLICSAVGIVFVRKFVRLGSPVGEKPVSDNEPPAE